MISPFIYARRPMLKFTEMSNAGVFVESKGEASEWSSQAFPRRKPNSWPIKCHWVTDFCDLNKALDRPICGGESSGQLLRHIEPSARLFACFDAISGFHQVAVDPESSKLLNITTQMGNFRYTVLGQGLCSSQDLFNWITAGSTQTDPDFNILKNVDDFCLFNQFPRWGNWFSILKCHKKIPKLGIAIVPGCLTFHHHSPIRSNM